MESALKGSLVGVMKRAKDNAKPGGTGSFDVENLEDEYAQFTASMGEKDAKDFEDVSTISSKKKDASTLGKASLGKPGAGAREKLISKAIDAKGAGDGPKPQTDSNLLDCPEHTRPSRRDESSGGKRGTNPNDSPHDDRRDNTPTRRECSPGIERREGGQFLVGQPRGKSMYCHLNGVNTENINMRFLDIDEGHLERFRMGGDNFEFELQVLMINVLSNQFLNVRGLPSSFGTLDIEWFLPGDVTPLDKLLATQGALVALKLRDSKRAIENMEHFESFTRGMDIGSLRVESTCQRLLENNIRMMSTCSALSDKAQNCVKSLTEGMRKLTDSTERSYAAMQGMSKEVANLRVENKESGKQQAKIMPGQFASSSSSLSIGASANAAEEAKKAPTESASDILKRMAKK
jgi:hypothetical protein